MSDIEETGSGQPLRRTALHALHLRAAAAMVPFAGYEMPVHYPAGILGEHLHTREQASLFDVSHMGQAVIGGPDHETAAAALEALMPGELIGLAPGEQRYTQILNAAGGIVDDLMVARPGTPEEDGRLYLIVNAARKEVDFSVIGQALPDGITLTVEEDRSLLALQGPAAAAVLVEQAPECADLAFMNLCPARIGDVECRISRSGYTGEDGYEISALSRDIEQVAAILLAHEKVELAGLGARDSLRLEAGLCLYGHDIDETTSPVEAGLAWSIGKRRRAEGGFPGAARVLDEIANGPARKRVGLLPEGRAPAREGTEIFSSDDQLLGTVTSGGFGPSFGGPLSMGYVRTGFSEAGTPVDLMVRGKKRAAKVHRMPFVPHRYYRKPRAN